MTKNKKNKNKKTFLLTERNLEQEQAPPTDERVQEEEKEEIGRFLFRAGVKGYLIALPFIPVYEITDHLSAVNSEWL